MKYLLLALIFCHIFFGQNIPIEWFSSAEMVNLSKVLAGVIGAVLLFSEFFGKK